jgi:hypothetical protein
MNPGHCSKVLNALSSFENLPIVFKVDFTDVDALRTALSWRNRVLMLFIRHIEVRQGENL